MRSTITTGLAATLALSVGASIGAPTLGQDDEQDHEDASYFETFKRPGLGALSGITREDGVVVLDTRDFCSYLLGAIWGDNEVTGPSLGSP